LAARRQQSAGKRNAEPAEPGRHFQLDILSRNIAQHIEPQRLAMAHEVGKLAASSVSRLKGDEIGEALDRICDMGVEMPQCRPRGGAEAVDPLPQQRRCEHREQEERQQHKRGHPGKGRERNEHRQRHDDGDDRRPDSVGVEILDRLDILRRQCDQIAGAAAQQIAGRQRVELAEQCDAHVGEQTIGHGVCLPRLKPVQDAGKRRYEGETNEQIAGGMAGFQPGDDQRAEDRDTDVGGNAARSRHGDNGEPPPPRRDEVKQRLGCATPIHVLDAKDRVLGVATLILDLNLGAFERRCG